MTEEDCRSCGESHVDPPVHCIWEHAQMDLAPVSDVVEMFMAHAELDMLEAKK